MTEAPLGGPVLFCYDESNGSLGAILAAARLIARPADAIVLTVWETVATRLAIGGAFAAGAAGATGGRILMQTK
jgi:hypothetical protein